MAVSRETDAPGRKERNTGTEVAGTESWNRQLHLTSG